MESLLNLLPNSSIIVKRSGDILFQNQKYVEEFSEESNNWLVSVSNAHMEEDSEEIGIQ